MVGFSCWRGKERFRNPFWAIYVCNCSHLSLLQSFDKQSFFALSLVVFYDMTFGRFATSIRSFWPLGHPLLDWTFTSLTHLAEYRGGGSSSGGLSFRITYGKRGNKEISHLSLPISVQFESLAICCSDQRKGILIL